MKITKWYQNFGLEKKGHLCFHNSASETLQGRDGWVDCVYLEVSHRRLLWKLQHLGGVKGKLLMKDRRAPRLEGSILQGDEEDGYYFRQ